MTKEMQRAIGPDLLDSELVGKPWLIRERAELGGPVYWSEKRRLWFVTGYPETGEALRDPRFSITQKLTKPEQTQDLSKEALELRRQLYAGGLTHLNFACGRSLLVMDPPEHTPYRALLQPYFLPNEVGRLEPTIERLVGKLLDSWEGQQRVDVMESLAYKLPILLFADILGIPENLRAGFHNYDAYNATRATKSNLATTEDYRAAASQGALYAQKFVEVISEKRACPAHDILSALITGTVNGVPLPEKQILAMIYLLNTGSQSTTTALIGNAIYFLLKFGHWEELRAEPSLLPGAIEEALRFSPPAVESGRMVTEDMDFYGQRLRKGDNVLFSYAAANRDPREFKEPKKFLVGRTPNRHLAFGPGPHLCLGAPFARREALVVLRRALERFPELELDGEPEHANTFGFSRLYVRPNEHRRGCE